MSVQGLIFVTAVAVVLPTESRAGVPEGKTTRAEGQGDRQAPKAGPGTPARIDLAAYPYAEGMGESARKPVAGSEAEAAIERRIKKPRDFRPTPAGGFVLGHNRAAAMIEAGYPFMRFELSYGLWSRFQLFAGYQGVYSFTSAGYGGVKLGLITTPKNTFGLSVAALGGYTHLRSKDDGLAAAIAGGNAGFGEFRLMLSGRKGRNGFFFNAGMRMSQVAEAIRCGEGETPMSMEDPGCLTRDRVLTTVFLEAGYEVRISGHVSYFVGLGVDVFSGAWYPAMVRFRNGILFDV